MNIAVALVLGLLGGWLIEWIIDWFYWRRPRPEPAAEALAAPKKERDMTPPATRIISPSSKALALSLQRSLTRRESILMNSWQISPWTNSRRPWATCWSVLSMKGLFCGKRAS